MKVLLVTAVIGLLVASLPCACSGAPPDSGQVVSKIIGTWMAHPDEYGQLLKSGTQTFRGDKTFIGYGAFGSGSRQLNARIEGKWWVEGNVLCEEVTKSSLPEAVPVGRRYRETILAITDTEMWARDEDGKEHFLTRFEK